LRRLNSIVTGLLAALLIFLALPRFVGALVQAPFEPLLAPLVAPARIAHPAGLAGGANPARKPGDIDQEIASRRTALEWIDDGRVWRALGAAQLKKARAENLGGTAGRARLAEAKASLLESLKRAPANPFAWSRLAYVEFLAGGEAPEIERALTMSAATGALEQRLVFTRLGIALMVWRGLTEPARLQMAGDIRTAQRLDPERLNKIIRRTGSTDIVRRLLRVRGG
jgi:hypothetical protein